MHDWQEIVAQHGRAVYETAWRLLGNDADAHDCAQDAFVAAVEFARRQPVKNWRALLHRLVTLKGIDMLRRNIRLKAFQPPAPTEKPVTESDPLRKMQQDELVGSLRTALAKLPARQAEAFTLRFLHDYHYNETLAQENSSSHPMVPYRTP
ncbi:MAG: RNA polymerase sigma factor [Planctomycetes bacterium]|nr:RNA polymerase sigma factor [Planctomycetota bacterium]